MAVLTAFAGSQAQAKSPQEHPKDVQNQLADLNFQVGDQVDKIFEFRMDGWKFLNRKHIIVLGGESQSYLVTLKHSCHGLSLPTTIVLAFTSKKNQLTRNDNFQLNNKGQTIDYCTVKSVHELEQIE